MTQLKPFYDQVQAIYDDDHTTDLLELFLDPTMAYSCAYFEREDMTLEQAQWAKFDLALGKLDLQPGQTLLEVGCGWGACCFRAAAKHRVNVIALTLSQSQVEYCRRLLKQLPPGAGQVDVRLSGWEEFDEPVDRIVSIAAFEHFRHERYPDFFARCRNLLPDGGRMLLHTIVFYNLKSLQRLGLQFKHEDVLFKKFIDREIFPGGQIVDPGVVAEIAESSGFTISRRHSLRQHYARTLDLWAQNLETNREEAIRRKSKEIYDRYMKYLTGCAKYFRSGHIDVFQFTLLPKIG